MAQYKRGEIWWVKLDPATGVEAQTLDNRSMRETPKTALSRKTRACLIVQNNFGNEESRITTVVPFLAKKDYPFVINVRATPLNNLDRERGLHFNQIRSVDSSRVLSKLGEIEDYYWVEIKKAIDIQLGF